MSLRQILLYPPALIYSLILVARHKLYDWRIFKVAEFHEPFLICVGNLNLGGTGKTPFTEFLIRELSSKYHCAVLSRGYGRKSKGFILASASTNAIQLGDEPTQMFHKYGHLLKFAVCEDRAQGVRLLKKHFPELQVIILDDAFQHRALNCHLNILLTPYHKPFLRDYLLPAGHLRDLPSAAKRADLIIMTKAEQNDPDISSYCNKPAFTAKLVYQDLNPTQSNKAKLITNIILLSGLANPHPLIQFCKTNFNLVHHLNFPDHHPYSESSIGKIQETFDTFAHLNPVLLTTEKDWTKLQALFALHQVMVPVYVVPISFSLDRSEELLKIITEKINRNLAT